MSGMTWREEVARAGGLPAPTDYACGCVWDETAAVDDLGQAYPCRRLFLVRCETAAVLEGEIRRAIREKEADWREAARELAEHWR